MCSDGDGMTDMGRLRIAVVGATGLVGSVMIDEALARGVAPDAIVPVASARSAGRMLKVGDAERRVEALDGFDFSRVDAALFSAGGAPSRQHALRAAAEGALVIDNSSAWRIHPGVPLVAPEVNPDAMATRPPKGVIANPNCSTIQLVMALKPLHDLAGLRRVVVATYQSVSGAGLDALRALDEGRSAVTGNAVPRIGAFVDGAEDDAADGETDEERKMRRETKEILGVDVPLTAMCVRVPVRMGHAEAVFCEFDKPIEPDAARAAIDAFSGCRVVDERARDGPATPRMAAGGDDTLVSRVRRDPSVPDGRGLVLWVVADNIRKGAALNALQILELAHKNGFFPERTPKSRSGAARAA